MDDDNPTSSTGPVADRMQALLSRAVEEQVSEQRTVSAVLSELRSQVGALAEGAPSATDLAGLEAAVRSVVSDLRTATTLLGQRLDALGSRVDELGRSSTGPAEASTTQLSELARQVAAQADAVGGLTASFGAVDGRLAQIGERLSDIGDAAGGVPAVATDLARLSERVDALSGLQHEVALMSRLLSELREDPAPQSLVLGLEGLREDVDALSGRLSTSTAPGADEVAALVAQQVTDRVVGTLAPQVAEVVLAQLGDQLVQALVPQVRSDTAQIIQSATADSERRLAAHVDDAVLALAEALLRRRRGGGQGGLSAPTPPQQEPVEEANPVAVVSETKSPQDAVEPDVDVPPAGDTVEPDGGTVEPNGAMSLAEDESPPEAEPADQRLVEEPSIEDVDEDGQPIEAVLPASERDPVDEPSAGDDENDPDAQVDVPAPEVAATLRPAVTTGQAPAAAGPEQPVVLAVSAPPASYVRPPTSPAPGSSGKRRPWWRPGG